MGQNTHESFKNRKLFLEKLKEKARTDNSLSLHDVQNLAIKRSLDQEESLKSEENVEEEIKSDLNKIIEQNYDPENQNI